MVPFVKSNQDQPATASLACITRTEFCWYRH